MVKAAALTTIGPALTTNVLKKIKKIIYILFFIYVFFIFLKHYALTKLGAAPTTTTTTIAHSWS